MTRQIRTLTLPEVETLLDWARLEGWNPGLGDAAPFFAADPEGFLGAFVDGELVAGISAVAYGADFGFIGLYICRPDRRGKGHGKAVWDAGMARLSGRSVGLDGVPEQQPNYRKMGFADAYGTVRYGGRLPGAGSAVPVDAALLPQLAALDARAFPSPRRSFLDTWLQPPRIARAVLRDGRVVGYGTVRRCVVGHKVGPLFAETLGVALDLVRSLCAAIDGELQIDVPAGQAGFIGALRAAGFTPGFATARMYRGPAPMIGMQLVFGTTSLELG